MHAFHVVRQDHTRIHMKGVGPQLELILPWNSCFCKSSNSSICPLTSTWSGCSSLLCTCTVSEGSSSDLITNVTHILASDWAPGGARSDVQLIGRHTQSLWGPTYVLMPQRWQWLSALRAHILSKATKKIKHAKQNWLQATPTSVSAISPIRCAYALHRTSDHSVESKQEYLLSLATLDLRLLWKQDVSVKWELWRVFLLSGSVEDITHCNL